ncbi:MAG TPA: glutamyl-tRNA reductase, partial [Baekduia sp.]|nr:glutamyl-tRNA reductase [Baekduia sp.]
DRARAMAARFGGGVVALDELPAQLERADVVVASTASPHPIVGEEELELVMRARGGRPLLLVDIAVPRDIDPACRDLPGVTLYDMDDLQTAVAQTISVREAEALRAEIIVEEEIQRFAGWLGSLAVQPTIRALREYGDAIVEQVLAENDGRWESASARDRARIEAMARSLMARLLHEPTIRLKSVDRDGGHGRVQFARELFGLTEGITEGRAGSNSTESDAPQADVRPLRRRGAGQ